MGATIIVHSRVDDSKTWKGTISEIKTDKARRMTITVITIAAPAMRIRPAMRFMSSWKIRTT